jgi:hypothetical protein
MKTKTKKTGKRPAVKPSSLKAILGRHFAVWLAVIIVAILAVGYQIVRANNDDGLPLNTPPGSLAREAQLDSIELQQESRNDRTYDQQQMVNAQGDSGGLSQMAEVTDGATR